ncbi:MAG TPA: DUF2254 domain-containing protein, partial [Blastocatellia bacterium]|nr:DUF2254 domain-containing protein [Blastocatellia bacterium]
GLMTWLQRYHIRYYIQNSIVVLPVLGIAAAIIIAWLLTRIEARLGWQAAFSAGSIQTVIVTFAAAMLTFIVFLSSTLLVAVQLASGQLTPRIIGFVFRDPVTKWTLTTFSFTFTLSLAVLVRIGDTAPLLGSRLAVWSCVGSVCAFFYLIDHIGKALRPSGVLKEIGATGRTVIESVYPRRLVDLPETPRGSPAYLYEEPALTIYSRGGGAVLAFQPEGLLLLAQRANCLIEMVPQVGDFVAIGDPLFRIYQNEKALSVDSVRQCVAVGQERTHEQDPALAFRIIMDIAAKALSPAINDPTTAVLAIDQIHHLLRNVGSRHLDEGVMRDTDGRIRVVYRTPDWEDFVKLATTEFRHFGGSSIQIIRRLRAMLENLIETLPPERTPALRQELDLLRRTAERVFPDPEDWALGADGDSQGLGGCGELRRSRKQVEDAPK